MELGQETVSMPLYRFKEVERLLQIKDSLDEESFKRLVEFYDKLPVAEFVKYTETWDNNRFSHTVRYGVVTKDEILKQVFDTNNSSYENSIAIIKERYDKFKNMSVKEFKEWKRRNQ